MSVVDEWVLKAEADYQSAIDLNRRRREPVPDVVCYHCQQAAEKYLKAYLVASSIAPPAIHGLEQLLALCVTNQPSLIFLNQEALLLDPYGMLIRYPGRTASVADAKDALTAARRFRSVLRKELGL